MAQNQPTILFVILTTLYIVLVRNQCSAQGFDAGAADPLKLGQIDPVMLELGATYLFITPFVVFVMGILTIPVALVFLFLIILPLYVPTSSSEGGLRSFSSRQILSGWERASSQVTTRNGDCINRIICEITNRNNFEERRILKREPVRNAVTRQDSDKHNSIEGPRRRKLFQNSPCLRFTCKPYELFVKLRNTFLGS